MGRFGNQLFQIASTIGVASHVGREAVFPAWRNHDHQQHNKLASTSIGKLFANQLSTMSDAIAIKSLRWPVYHVPFGTCPVWRNLPKKSFSLDGFMQSEKYFIHCEAFIREQFRTAEITRAPLINKSYCSIHVRRGDYVNLNVYLELRRFYYDEAVKMMVDRGFRKFFVFSDDINETRELFQKWDIGAAYPYVDIYFSDQMPSHFYKCTEFHEQYINDFVTMKSYGGHIISNSTFSWWTAYLSDSDCVIAPRDWVMPHMKRDMPDHEINADRFISIDAV